MKHDSAGQDVWLGETMISVGMVTRTLQRREEKGREGNDWD